MSEFVLPMLQLMKIAIPTNDGLMICPGFGESKGFLVLTIELGEIIREEIRWHPQNDLLASSGILFPLIGDCQIVMVNSLGPVSKELLSEHKIEIFQTRESIITNAYVHYQDEILTKEANTCCCP